MPQEAPTSTAPRFGVRWSSTPPLGQTPTEPKSLGFIVALCFAQLGFFIALLGPVMVSMAVKVSTLTDDPVARTGMIGAVLGTGAIAAAIGNVFFGRLSDRTMSRFGRRRPWIVGGVAVMAVGLFLISVSTTPLMLTAFWFLTQLGANAAFSPFIATLGDQLPQKQYAKVSALIGIMQNVGILGAIWLATLFSSNMLLLFMVPAAIGVLGMVVYAVVLPDPVRTDRPPKLDLLEILRSFWVNPIKHSDFALAWWSRFLLILSAFLFTTFRLTFVQERLGVEEAASPGVVLNGVLVYTIVLVPIGYLAGWISDRTGRRKALVGLSAVLFAVGTYLLMHIDSPFEFYLVEALLGAAYGIYMGVDMALVLQVLPNKEDTAKDLGVFNLANAGPQSLAPYLGGALLVMTNVAGESNYGLMLGVAAAAAVIGGLVIIPIKKAK
ncbi:MFS transporter [Zhihengliuella halotolerans]|uniref:MFS transporter n=1 Tax=Zhihengliuella halotolerans TaxID=370736 RepID=UPI000C7FDE51|nr:MFS transporter [Zhihengliuella halotolerans]